MKRTIFRLAALLILLFPCGRPAAAAESSHSLRPRWIKEQPVPTNGTYTFEVTFVAGCRSLEEARAASREALAKNIERKETVRTVESLDRTVRQHTDGRGRLSEVQDQDYAIHVLLDGEPVQLHYIKHDEYWVLENGEYSLYTLFSVARKGQTPRFDEVTFTERYGSSAVVRSLIPGWGQFYKGQMYKGTLIAGGTIGLIAGIVSLESSRAIVLRWMQEQPTFAQEYLREADELATSRNIAIGAALALYVYNLIDAAVSPGARRAVVHPSSPGWTLAPATDGTTFGISLAYRF